MHKLGHFWLTFCPKICIFLRYYYESAFFSIGRTKINVIISCSYPEVTFDHTRHDIFAHLARQQAFFLEIWPKWPYLGPKMPVLDNNALWQSCNIGWKTNHKVVNFGKWFLCQFSPKTWNFLHGPFLTPQKSEDEKVLKNIGMQRGEKRKKREGGVFHR